MRPTLPRASGHETLPSGRLFCGFAMLLVVACTHHADPPVVPGRPLAAEPDISVDTMDVECAGLTKALDRYGLCPNLDDDDRAGIKNMIQYAQETFEAGKKGNPDAQAQHTIAIACRKAAKSVEYATLRCQAGPRPRVD
ncbi:MAG: hypothetical protein JWO36_6748 [Myxococcales bacterium]|nr:hypothetical protein [Myxococcales bacterium]